jgi:hypothetical protein
VHEHTSPVDNAPTDNSSDGNPNIIID